MIFRPDQRLETTNSQAFLQQFDLHPSAESAWKHSPGPVSDHIEAVIGKPIMAKTTEWLAKQTYLCL